MPATATIGTFKKAGTEYTGEIFTLNVQAKNVRIVPETNQTSDNAPTAATATEDQFDAPPEPSGRGHSCH